MLTRRQTLLLAAACGAAAGLAAARAHAAAPGRVLVLGGDLAEIAFALGAGSTVIATDDTALWPPEAAALPKVGYLRRISAEGVLSLLPDLVLANPGAGPRTALDQIAAAGVRVETGPEGESANTVPAKIAFMGRALDRAAAAETCAARFEAEMARTEAALAPLDTRPRVLFLISLAGGTPVAAGTGTAADAMIGLARGTNAAAAFAGYKPVSAEAAIGLAPDVLLLPDHALEGYESPKAAVRAAGLGATPAGREGRIVVMDGLRLLGFGLRTPQAVAELARALHTDAALEGL
ncbi:MAG: ABC transporter substrate-binding protein [Rhodobacteraceae bacterium]|nr:ABC transporter substrate-binding protein [Paracoccaceae bacterium]